MLIDGITKSSWIQRMCGGNWPKFPNLFCDLYTTDAFCAFEGGGFLV